MKTKASLILMFLLTMLAQAACAPSVNACPTATADTRLMTNTEDGYCVLYPAAASSNMPGWIVINPISNPGDVPGDAWVNIHAEDAAGRTVDQVAEEIMTNTGTGFNATVEEVQVDGGDAIVVDGLPGQDSNRLVITVRNDRLYILTFMPWYPGTGQPTPLEHMYETILQSIHFLPPA